MKCVDMVGVSLKLPSNSPWRGDERTLESMVTFTVFKSPVARAVTSRPSAELMSGNVLCVRAVQKPGAWSLGTTLTSPFHTPTLRPLSTANEPVETPPITGSFSERHVCVVAGALSKVVRPMRACGSALASCTSRAAAVANLIITALCSRCSVLHATRSVLLWCCGAVVLCACGGTREYKHRDPGALVLSTVTVSRATGCRSGILSQKCSES